MIWDQNAPVASIGRLMELLIETEYRSETFMRSRFG